VLGKRSAIVGVGVSSAAANSPVGDGLGALVSLATAAGVADAVASGEGVGVADGTPVAADVISSGGVAVGA